MKKKAYIFALTVTLLVHVSFANSLGFGTYQKVRPSIVSTNRIGEDVHLGLVVAGVYAATLVAVFVVSFATGWSDAADGTTNQVANNLYLEDPSDFSKFDPAKD